MKITTILLCGTVLTATPWLASAQDYYDAGSAASQGPYIELQGGYTMLRDHSFDVPAARITTDSKNGYAVLLNSGYEFGRWGLGSLRVEAELGYRSNDVDKFYATPRGINSMTRLGNPYGHTQVWSLMFNVINDFRPGTGFDPYIGVGAGYARIGFNHYGVSLGGSAGPDANFVDDTDNQFAYQGVVGFRSQFTRNLDLDVNWRYFATRDPSFTNADGQSVESDYTSSAVMVGLSLTY